MHFTPWQTCSFTLQPLADLFIYTSTPGRPVHLHFTPWQTCSFTLQPLADLFIYTSTPGRPVHLHFTPWQTCSFTLQPLADLFLNTSPMADQFLYISLLADLFLYTSPMADLFLYTSTPSRPVPLHFNPRQTCSFTLQPLADLFIYTSPPGRPVHLHFNPWQTCSFTLHPGRPVPLHFTPRQTCSFQHHLYFPRKHSAMLQSLPEDDWFIYNIITRYSFIQLGEMRQCGVNKIAQASKQQEESLKTHCSNQYNTVPPIVCAILPCFYGVISPITENHAVILL